MQKAKNSAGKTKHANTKNKHGVKSEKFFKSIKHNVYTTGSKVSS